MSPGTWHMSQRRKKWFSETAAVGQWHDLTMTCVGLTASVWVQDSRDERAASLTLTALLTQDVRLQLQALDLRCPHQSEAARSTGQGLLIDDSQNRISIRGQHREKGSSVRCGRYQLP